MSDEADHAITLAVFSTYSPLALRRLIEGRRFPLFPA